MAKENLEKALRQVNLALNNNLTEIKECAERCYHYKKFVKGSMIAVASSVAIIGIIYAAEKAGLNIQKEIHSLSHLFVGASCIISMTGLVKRISLKMALYDIKERRIGICRYRDRLLNGKVEPYIFD